jgi:hypothetical protein
MVISSNPVFRNLIVAFSSGSGMHYDGGAAGQVNNCDFYGNSGGDFSGQFIPGLGEIFTTNPNGDPCDVYQNISLDPQFVNVGSGDYHLAANSPCIDAGDPSLPNDPNGTVSDIGAYPITQPYIRLTSPNGSEQWLVNSLHSVSWITVGNIPNVHIHVYRGTPPHGTFLQAITAGTPNTGSYPWIVFPWLQPGSDYYIGIAETDDDPWDYSNAPFTISSPSRGYLSGVVRNSSAMPLDSAIITLSPGNRRDTTDTQGAFQMDTLVPGQYLLTASRAGYIQKDTLVSVAAGNVTEVNVGLMGEVVAILEIVDENDVAIGGANVRTMLGPTSISALTSETGVCTLRVIEGSYEFNLSAAGFIDRRTDSETLNGAGRLWFRKKRLVKHQITIPTYVFLIRGLAAVPPDADEPDQDDGEELWESMEASFRATYRGNSNAHVSRISINPTASLVTNLTLIQTQIGAANPESNARIILVGHSMGGLIARFFAAFGNKPVSRLFTIDTPHAGSNVSWLPHILFNSCANLAEQDPRHCENLPHPAYLELTSAVMTLINEVVLVPQERTKTTEYILISGTHDEQDEKGDWVVSLNSQQGKNAEGQSLLDEIESRVVRPDEFRCGLLHCLCVALTFHNCMPSQSNVVSYVIENLNTPIAELQTMTASRSAGSEPDASVLWQGVSEVFAQAEHSDTVHIPDVPYLDFAVIGISPPSSWALEKPTGEILLDSAGFADEGGFLSVDSSNQMIKAMLPNPIPGNWILHTQLVGADSAVVAVSVSAPMPIFLEPMLIQAVSVPGNPVLLSATASAVEGVSVDSVVASFLGDSVTVSLHDDGLSGDVAAGDSIWSGVTDTLWEAGTYSVELVAYGHAGTEQYRVQSSLEFHVEQPVAQLVDSVIWQPVDADSNGLFERLNAAVPVMVDSSARLTLAATLVGPSGEFITATQTEDSLTTTPPPGGWWLVPFPVSLEC